MNKSLEIIVDALPALAIGAGVTIRLTITATILGSILGIALSLARLSKRPLISWPARLYIDFIRGTPLLVQLMIIYFGFPALFKSVWNNQLSISQWSAASIGLSLHAAAYLAEVFRAGIQSIGIGQREASESLGLEPWQTMRYVIFPQAFRRMIPPLGNEFIILLKDTSLVAFIGYQDLLRQGQLITAKNFRPFEIYITVALIYLVLTLMSSQFFAWLERRLDPLKQSKKQASIPLQNTAGSR